MQHHHDTSKKHSSRDLLINPAATANPSTLENLTHLASWLDFESSEITVLKVFRDTSMSEFQQNLNSSMFVTEEFVEDKKFCCRVLQLSEYETDHQYLFIDHLHNFCDY